ncbi:MAG: SCO family protein [Bacillota bacterium]
MPTCLRALSFTLLFTFTLLSPLPTTAQVPPPPPQTPPSVFDRIGFDQQLGNTIPLDLPFRDEAGRTVTLRQYFGHKPVILALVYYECPMLCTMTLNGMLGVFKVISPDIGRDFDVVTVSFNPRETSQLAAAKKDSYLKQYKRPGAADGWHFLTGDESSIHALTQACGFRYYYDTKTNQYAHAAGIMVLTPQGQLSRYFYGLEYSPRDVQLGLTEASSGKVGSLADKVLLLCYHYDPSTGRYGFAVIRAIRIGGILILLSLGTFILLSLRRERRLRTPSPGSGTSVPLFKLRKSKPPPLPKQIITPLDTPRPNQP